MDNSLIENMDKLINWDLGFKYNSNYNFIRERWENSTRTKPTYCYGTYQYRITKNTRKIYFYYPFLPSFALDVIDQFNKRFNYIKYDALNNQTLYLAVGYSSYPYSKILKGKVWKRETTFPVICPLLTINYDEKYNTESIYIMNYLLPIFLRMIYLPEKHINFLETPDSDDLLEWMIDVNNSNLKYRSLSEKRISLENFMKLDDIDLMNDLALRERYILYAGQTEMMRRISNAEK